VFSRKEEDPALDEWNVKHVPLDEELVNPVGRVLSSGVGGIRKYAGDF